MRRSWRTDDDPVQNLAELFDENARLRPTAASLPRDGRTARHD
jgi:hypothetical protein